VLRRNEGGQLWPELQGNSAILLKLEDADLVAGVGAGRGISSLPNIGGALEVSNLRGLREQSSRPEMREAFKGKLLGAHARV
jgi:hypothetical protein